MGSSAVHVLSALELANATSVVPCGTLQAHQTASNLRDLAKLGAFAGLRHVRKCVGVNQRRGRCCSRELAVLQGVDGDGCCGLALRLLARTARLALGLPQLRGREIRRRHVIAQRLAVLLR